MAFYIYPPRPGSPHGPCEGKCDHRNCEKMRRDAETNCPLCEKPLGYDRKVTFGEGMRPVHVLCVWTQNRDAIRAYTRT